MRKCKEGILYVCIKERKKERGWGKKKRNKEIKEGMKRESRKKDRMKWMKLKKKQSNK